MKRLIAILTFCVFYTLGYIVLAVGNINPEGTGTAFFLMPVITWLLVLMAFIPIIGPPRSRDRVFFFVTLVVHYVVTAYLLLTFQEEPYKGESRLLRTWEINRNWVLLTISWYFIGQLILWGLFAVKQRAKHKEINVQLL
jgi:hypothetical protein